MNSPIVRNILMGVVAAAIAVAPRAVLAGKVYSVRFDPNEVVLDDREGEYVSVSVPGCFNQCFKVGDPDLPARSISYVVPHGRVVADVRVLSTKKARICRGVKVLPVQRDTSAGMEQRLAAPDNDLCGSDQTFPGRLIDVAHTGSMRGLRIVTIWIYPLEYSPSEMTLDVYEEIQFEFELESAGCDPTVSKTIDTPAFRRTLNELVANPEDVSIEYILESIGGGSSRFVDGYPCVIITNETMQSSFENLAHWKTISGCPTEIKTVEDIASEYPGDSLVMQIRSYITDMYNNYNTEYVLLGGDVDVIPGVRVFTQIDSAFVFTDLYYSCLDHNWNENGDSYVGRPEFYGDTVDFYPEVYVGRLPISTHWQSVWVVEKIMDYMLDTSYTDYQNRALLISSTYSDDINDPTRDDPLVFNQQIAGLLPLTFDTEFMHEQPAPNVWELMNSGYGLITFYGHASCLAENFLAYHGTYPGARQPIWYSDLDSLQNRGRYSFFLNSTCWNNSLTYSSEEKGSDTVCVSRSFLINPVGGGIGYLGSTTKNSSPISKEFHQDFIQRVFADSAVRLGEALAYAKLQQIQHQSHVDNFRRLSIFSYVLLGDPHLRLWSDAPQGKLMLEVEEYLTGYVGVTVRTRLPDSSLIPVEGALVCEFTPPTYCETRITDAQGKVDFLGGADYSYFVATKQNYFPGIDSSAFEEPGGPGGCPMLLVDDGNSFQAANNMLAFSEDPDLTGSKDSDCYPIYDVYVHGDGTIKLRIAETQKDKSYFDCIAASYVTYPANTSIAYTSRHEFRLLGQRHLEPVKATDHLGKDVLEKIIASDGLYYESDEQGFMTVVYEKPNEDTFSVSLNAYSSGGGGIEPPPGGQKGSDKRESRFSTTRDKRNITVSVLNSFSDWEIADVLFPRVNDFQYYVDLAGRFVDGRLTVRINWDRKFSVDYLPYRFFDGDPFLQKDLPLVASSHSALGNVASELSELDGEEMALCPGQHVNVVFEVPEPLFSDRLAVAITCDGRYAATQPSSEEISTVGVIFHQNHPNPFNPSTVFSFYLPAETHVRLIIYNILGQRVADLVNEALPAGDNEVVWHGVGEHGRSVPTGVYFAQLQASGRTLTKKIMVLK